MYFHPLSREDKGGIALVVWMKSQVVRMLEGSRCTRSRQTYSGIREGAEYEYLVSELPFILEGRLMMSST